MIRSRLVEKLPEYAYGFEISRELQQHGCQDAPHRFQRNDCWTWTPWTLWGAAAILNYWFSNSYPEYTYYVFPVKLPSCECHKTLTVDRWTQLRLVPSGNNLSHYVALAWCWPYHYPAPAGPMRSHGDPLTVFILRCFSFLSIFFSF